MKNFLLLFLVLSFASLSVRGQSTLSENEMKYIVKTVQPQQQPKKETSNKAKSDTLLYIQPEEDIDSMNIWFPHHSLCDWQPGMRFMVIPDKRDLVIKTFVDKSTGNMVSSNSLLHKVMIYKGHDDGNGGLHEHVNFTCEESNKDYFFEVPMQSFDDYCFTKFGVPTLAYLDEVDSARVKLMGKKLITVADRYYIDDPKTSDGFIEITDVPKDMEVEVVAVGVGTRNFPVKIIVCEKGENGRQFFQNVCISKTNSGLRDDELEISNMVIHTFDGSFKLADDKLSVHPLYKKYNGKDVYTLIPTTVMGSDNSPVRLSRLTALTIKSIRSVWGSEYAKVTLYDPVKEKTYTKQVLFYNKNRIGEDIDNQRELFVENLFAIGDPKKMKNVRESVWTDLQNGVVRNGFSSEEVKMSMGNPTSTGKSGSNVIWYYKNASGTVTKKVKFNGKTMRVIGVDY
jgi:hypothetical protein